MSAATEIPDKDIQGQIETIELYIRQEVYFLERTSNPMKCRRRKQAIKKYKEQIKELKRYLPKTS